MEYNELLYEFVDGTTDVSQEQALFAELAGSEELRSDLKQLLAIRLAVQNDTKAYIPPVSSTLSLFSALGFSAPAALVPVEVGLGAKVLHFLGNSSKAIATGVVMSGITALCMYLWMNETDYKQSPLTADNNSSISTEHTGDLSKSKTEIRHSKDNSSTISSQTDHSLISPPERIIKYVYIREKNLTSEGQDIQSTSIDNKSLTSPVENTQPPISDASADKTSPLLFPAEYLSSLLQVINPTNTAIATPRQITNDIPAFAILPIENSPQVWTLELRRLDTRSTEIPTLITTAPAYNNLAITGLYSWNTKFFAGIELAQEQYFQSFTSIDGRGNTYLYEQNPSLSSFSIVARYVPFEWQKFQPIVQLGLGGTAIGPIGRGLIGLRYSPEDNVSFMLNIEGSTLQYSHQNINYTLTKFGLSYGISLHL